MAVTSWSYRGKSGSECGAAGLTFTFERVRGVCRGGPSGPLSTSTGAADGAAPLSSLWVFASAERATCQVSGLSDNSNFHCCTEILKSPYPRLPFDRAEGENRLAGGALLHLLRPLLPAADFLAAFNSINPSVCYQVTEQGERERGAAHCGLKRWHFQTRSVKGWLINSPCAVCFFFFFFVAHFRGSFAKLFWMGRTALGLCACRLSTTQLKGR